VIRVTLKGLLGRKLRLILTSLAIVMGVGMVSGTYVLTDTINAGIQALLGVAYANTNAVVTGKAVFGSSAPAFPASTLGRIERLPSVAAAGGDVGAQAEIVGVDGKVISRGGASGLGVSVDPGYEHLSPFRLVAGGWPAGPGEVAIDAETASSQDFRVGDRVGIIVRGGREHQYTVTGVANFGNSSSPAGATLSIFNLRIAQQLFGEQGELDQIDVAAKPGVSSATLLSQIKSVLPPHTQVRTSQQ
jgi:putative ABC transport system permease protein